MTVVANITSRYQLQTKLGEGGMGVVYRALDRLTGQIVALKQVTASGDQLQFASQSTDQDFRLSLAQEFRTLAGLRHPHIISVLDYGFNEQRQPFFTMQLLEKAQELTAYAASLEVAGKTRIIVEMLQALAYLHRRGIIHRDLKPANVLVTAEGTVKVMDFGLALHKGDSVINLYTGAVGTLAYMAPELFSDEQATIESDLYAVGVMVYEVFTGKYPFNTQNMALLVNGILHQKPDTTMLDYDLAEVVDKLLAKSPDQRYDSVDAVIEALCTAVGQPVSVENAALRESFLQAAKFVGRDAELEQLINALDEAIKGKGSAWLIGGESGVGKSRLLDELRTRALVEGALVVRGQAVEGGGLPYQLWRDPLRRLVLSTTLNDLEASILKTLIPDINGLLGREIPDAPELDGAAGQQRLSLTIADIFRRQQQPILLLVEDLQWTAESLIPLKHLTSLTNDLSLMIVGTYRDDEKPDLPAEFSDAQTLKLPRLTDADIASLSEAMLGEAGKQPHLLDLLKRETEGNTFFMVEVVRSLAAATAHLQDIAFMTLPEKVFAGGVQQVIQRRLERIPVEYQHPLTIAAAAGRQLDLNVLTHALQRSASSLILDDWLTICSSAAILEFNDGQWRFSHDKIREFVLQQILVDQRQQIYETLALAIENLYPDDAAYVVMLSDYWYQSNNSDKALYYIQLAAHQLFKISSFREALLFAERGLSMPEVGNYATELHNLAGKIHIRYGNYVQATDAFRQSMALAKKPVDLVNVLDSMSQVHWRQGDYDAALKFSQEAMDIARVANYEAGIVSGLGSLGLVALYQGNPVQAQAYFEQSIAISRSIGDLQATALALDHLGIAARRAGNYEQAKQYLLEGSELARQIGDLEGVASCLNNIGAVLSTQGDLAESQAYLEQALTIQREIGNLYSIAMGLTNIGIVSLYQEDYLIAEDYLQQGLMLQRKIGDPHSMLLSLVHLVVLHLKQGQRAEARLLIRETIELGRKIDSLTSLLELVGYVIEDHVVNQYKLEQAALWLKVVLNHPATFAELREHMEKLYLKAGGEIPVANGEHERNLDLDTILDEILTEYT